MTSTNFTPTKVYQQNDWSVVMLDERLYRVTDPKGNQCISRSIRVISPDEIAISHPVAQDARINTRKLVSLPLAFRGDLTNESIIKGHQDWASVPGLPEDMRVHKNPTQRGNNRWSYSYDMRDDS